MAERCIFCGHRNNEECEQCVRRMKRREDVAGLANAVYAYMQTPEHSEPMEEYGRMRDAAYDALSRLAALAMETDR